MVPARIPTSRFPRRRPTDPSDRPPRLAPDEDGRALAGAYAIAGAFALVWLSIVVLTPLSGPSLPFPAIEAPAIVGLRDLDDSLGPSGHGPVGRQPTGRHASRADQLRDAAHAIAQAFTGSSASGPDVGHILGGTQVTRAATTRAAESARAVLATTDRTGGPLRPGLGGMAPLGSSARALGDVRGTDRIARVAPTIVLPPVVATRPAGTAGRGVAEVGSAVRERVAQLQSCYEMQGLTRDPTLAGIVTVAMTIAATGRVTAVDVVRRTWAGAGAEQVEACVRAAVRTWRFPPFDGSSTTYEVLVSFTGR